MENLITERVDAITQIPEEARSITPPIPKSCKIELTARCNFKCTFCARSQHLRTQQEMDREFYERILREMRDAGVEELGVFYLGESFLCKWLPEAIAYAKEIGFPYVFCTTNASVSTRDKVKACMEAGLDSLKFSLNYTDAKQFEEIARVDSKWFDIMLQNVKDAHHVRQEGGYSCGLYASFIEYNGEQGTKMKRVIQDIAPYLDQVYGLPLYNQAALVAMPGGKPGAGNRGRLGNLRDPLPCWALFSEAHISFDGRLAACCFDHDGRFEMGDLNRTSFKDAWHSKKFRALRAANLAKNVAGTACEACVAVD